MRKDLTVAVREYMAKIGSRGGKATGASKVRCDSKYYRDMRLRTLRKRKKCEAPRGKRQPKEARSDSPISVLPNCLGCSM